MKLAERAVEDVNRAVTTAQTFNQPLPLGSSLAQALQESASAPVSGVAAVAAQPVAAQVAVMTPVAPLPVMAAPTTSPAATQTPAPQQPVSREQRPVSSLVRKADAQQYVQQGRELIQKNQFNQALSHLDRAIDADPWSAAAYNLRGYAHLRLLQFEQAIADCSEAIRLQPNFLNAL